MPYADNEKRLAHQREYNTKHREEKREYNKKYREANRENIRIRTNQWAKENAIKVKGHVLKRRYRITTSSYNELLKNQNGCCAICGRHHTEFTRALHIDHCHKSNKIRGLLCVNCNTALGHFKEGINLLQQAIEKDRDGLSCNSKVGLAKFSGDINLIKKAIKYLSS